jgi:predicted ATPase/class 3 adenylate cyclase
MRLRALNGERGSALAQYEACRRALREELDVEPGEETQRLYQRIRDGELGPPQAEQRADDSPPPIPAVRQVPRAPAPSPASQPTSVAPPGPTPLQGERRILTALLADVQGSTALAGQIDVELWVEIMNRVFQVLGTEIYRYGGEIDQYRGDGLVAFFGATATHEDDPERAVLAGLSMQEAVQRYATELAETEGVELRLRVGVNTGEVIAASVGDSRQHREETAMGRAIALAARMETACEPGTVLVSENTYRLVAPLFQWQPLGEILVKGFTEPVAVYRPMTHRGQAGKGRGIEGLESPLVGRDAEVRALREALDRLGDGLGGIVTVVGEAGLGKSRLVAEIRKLALSADEGAANLRSDALRWAEGRCLSYATGVAYGLWIDGLRALLGTAPDAAPADVRRRLWEWVQALCPECVDQVYPYLGRMLSLSLEEEAAAHLRGIEAQGLKVLTFRAVEIAFQRAAEERPLVVVCEDLHWADATSLELLESLMPLAERAPLLLVCVLRPEREHGCWQVRETAAREYPHRHSDLWLEPLSQAESGELVRNLLRVEDLPETLRARILERGEGNPFYVEEILRSLIDHEIVVHDEASGRWRATQAESKDSGDEIPLPDTLQGVLRARIDRLPAEARRVLQTASVIGRIFSYRVLEAVVSADAPLTPGPSPPAPRAERRARGVTLDTHLLTLQREQMIREQARLPERQYAFKHYLTVEAAYGGILRRERRASHRRVAEALERLYPERLEERLGLLARHWEQAGKSERARDYLGRAGTQAAAQFANQEATSYLDRALDLTPESALAERYALLLAREKVYDLQGAREAQRQDLAVLESLAEQLADPARQAEVALRRAHLASRTQDYSAAAEAARSAIRWAENAQDVARQAAAHRELGRAMRYQHGHGGDAAREELDHALLLARAAGSRQVEVDVLHELGAVWNSRYKAEAEPYFAEQLRICRETGNRRDEGRALRDLGLSLLYRAQYTEALIHLAESLQVCLDTGNRRDEGWALHSLSIAYGELGDDATAHAYGMQALHVHNETGDRLGKWWTAVVLIQTDTRAGDFGRVQSWLVHTRGWWSSSHNLLLGDLALAQGDPKEAQARYEAAFRDTDEDSKYRGDALSGLVSVALAEGDLSRAQQFADEALRGLAKGYPWASILTGLRVYLACYRGLHASGDPRAQEVLEEAHRLLHARAETIDDPALRRSFLENVAVNREIVRAYAEREQGDET